MRRFDVLVIGAGHAGCEAALAASRLGVETALVTISLHEIGKMPCNPAIGGPGKSQLVREIDALGGAIARVADEAAIHIRMLNTSKGAAMQVRRAQTDRELFKSAWRRTLDAADGLEIVEGMVEGLVVRGGRIAGVRLWDGEDLEARAVVVCAGTFLNGKILLGDEEHAAGRAGEPPSVGLAESLRGLGLRMRRLKTGTPPRVHRDTIDAASLEAQPTSDRPLAFSFRSEPRILPDLFPVYVTHTNEVTHRIIRENLKRSAVYNGLMDGVGPRHCPSLETKIVRFPGRTSHKVFCEPEGRESPEVYLQGIYTAFSPDIQDRIVGSIQGLEGARIERYGYNIEYDSVDPLCVGPTLAVEGIEGLYLAGQVIGTTGYEEAAALGLLAGINAVRSLRVEPPIVLDRGRAFLGVLVDDLVTKGITEPYRMLPSRAEYRISLREGNADLRLSDLGREIGLLPERSYEAFAVRREAIRRLVDRMKRTRVGPSDPINRVLAERGSPTLSHNGASLFDLLRRPEISLGDLVAPNGDREDVRLEAEIEGKYAGYIAQQERAIELLRRTEGIAIPEDLDFATLDGISMEGRDLLATVRPRSFGQASRVPGVSKADLSMLAIHLRRS
jgi:tRNA uridine 5-carboxymethylaminomethyl modification enzyme